ncbi:midnolin-like isoform X2 [Sinocyclocheilus rhinocerous]|uniref:Midnolin-like n=1 Tax=Sinocyclocheilus rhinocerous TaxID=307959 RepID=A0A673HHA8_9TELE|nr:PREDICTED: midnolin-like isoform X1 [Sinocyclocheilus rhinocerous]XP_016395751.1 PREDICTED: midnolin-like isoform X1 [Sinocyclocheilus rhinocerous]XP_016395752.1 PREDICTED: midnolin-like isoform X2 [Sinocyclocheilus rhinocerous]
MERSCSSHGSRSRCPELLNGDASMNVSISSTTGSRFELSVPLDETVLGLKRRLSEKLRVPGERLLLLHRDTRLNSGKLLDFGVADGSRLTLVPTVEAGLMSQSCRSEQSVLRALETLSDAQVSDFLSGRSPLTLALRVGDHMMFVQLQLAAQPSVSRGPAGPNQTPTGAVSSENPSDSQQRALDVMNAPSSSHVHHAHSTQSPAPALQSHPVSHAHHSQSPAHAPPCAQAEGSTQSPRQRCKPGAVIESLVNHAPGVFSGTFSGTLHPNCQDSSGRPRRDVSTILQILNDLLSATRHCQGSPPTLTHLHCPPASPCSPPPSPTSDQRQPHAHLRRPSGERLRQTENKAMRCKLEQLRLLLQQRRLRRKARRDSRGPYRWITQHKNLDLDYEEPVWKPDVPSDVSAELVLA